MLLLYGYSRQKAREITIALLMRQLLTFWNRSVDIVCLRTYPLARSQGTQYFPISLIMSHPYRNLIAFVKCMREEFHDRNWLKCS